jgi:SAM-dependent methyltransferase
MSSNQQRVWEKYANGTEGERAFHSQAESVEFHYTKKILGEYVKPYSRIIELGCGGGYYGLHFADKCAEYTGIDITPENIAVFNEKIKAAGLSNVTAQTGDATNLENIADGVYDIVLCLGPMYHLPPEERELVFAECGRIAKDGAIAAFAYICPTGAYLQVVLTYPDSGYPNEAGNEILKTLHDDLRPDLFFFSFPEGIEERAKAHGFEKIKNRGVHFAFNEGLINEMSKEKFALWLELTDYMTERENCTGLSTHNLLVCRKK